MDRDLFIPVHSFLHDNMETCSLSDSVSTHPVQKRSPCNVPSDMINATLQFLRGMAQEVAVVSVSVAELKGFRQQRQKNGEPLPHVFPLAQFHTT